MEWSQTAEGAYCSQQNDLGFDTVYGKLYNHHAASDERNLCPVGWHVPLIEEWVDLQLYLGGGSLVGGTMKARGRSRREQVFGMLRILAPRTHLDLRRYREGSAGQMEHSLGLDRWLPIGEGHPRLVRPGFYRSPSIERQFLYRYLLGC
ncbi:MAG: fibrobacter succinogenes major paralogous domain-containing protein [Flavobacteriales bacterium]|nr:fibrobacter succinogenes major paralogous domain-containing protein [Flavobacteriales bacterium]